MSYLHRTLMLLFAVLVMSMTNIGTAWGATHTVTPNIGGTQYEIYNIYSNSSAYAFFSNATTIRSAYSSWVSGELSKKSDGGATAISGWLATGSGKPGYGKAYVQSGKTVTMTVTNCIEVAFVSKSGGSGRTSNLSVKLNGVEVGSVATNGNTSAAVTYGTALDASKTYTITLSGSNSSDCEVDQIRFKAPAVCSAALGGTTSNPSATVGESAGTISCTINNGAAKTATSYQWYKNTSKSTSGATSISGATSSTYSPNEASAGTYYYYCTVQTAQITTDGADAARITSGISDAFVFAPAAASAITRRMFLNLGGIWDTGQSYWVHVWDGSGNSQDVDMTQVGSTGYYYADVPISMQNIQYRRNANDNKTYDLPWGGQGENQCAKITAWHGGDGNAANPSSTSWEIYHDGRQTFALGNYVYYDNSVTQWSNVYFRIGKWNVSHAFAMTKEPGTKDLYSYQRTGTAWEGYEVFNFADNWANQNGNVYYPDNDKDTWSGNETNFARESLSSNRYYRGESPYVTSNYAHYHNLTELSAYTVTASATNCTVTLQKCTNYGSDTYTDLSSGETVLPTQYIKVTVTPNTGYQFSAVEVTGVGTITEAADGTPGVYYVTGNAMITATCTAKTCTVNFDNNGGTGGTNTVTATYGSAMPSKASNLPTRDGYTFDGYWDSETNNDGTGKQYYKADGTSKNYWDKNTTSNTTLYAKWNCITPDAPTASAIAATDGCGVAATFSAEIPSLPSYVTWYWQTSSDGTSTSNPASTDYTTDATAGSKTIYLRAKNTVCDTWSEAATKSATVRTAVTAAWGTAPADGTVGGSMTASVTTNYSAGLRFSSSDATVASVNETSGAISYLKAGTTTITATVTGADSYCSTASVNKSITVSAAAGLTSIEENTLYQPLNMLCTGMSPLPGSDTYFTDDAYSTDNRFYYDVSSGNGPKAHTISEVTLGSGKAYEAAFTSEMWVKGTSTVTDGIPSAPSIKFLTPSTSGTLYLYIESGSCPVKFKKEDGTASNITSLTEVVSGKIYSTTVEANSVYYIYGNGGSNTGVYGLKLITCTTPAAPTGFTAGSITSTGATFTITDAANAASYDIYYSTSSTAPTAGTAATTTSTSKTKAVTGLTASTTYYAWVRSVCDADHKSAWVALSGSSFTTTSTPAELTAIEANTLYGGADIASITLTGSDQNFTGLSANTKFQTLGAVGSAAFGKTVSTKSVTDDIDTKNFTAEIYVRAANNTSSTSDPTEGAIEFFTPATDGTLYIYLGNTGSNLTLKKHGVNENISLSGANYKKIDVTANTHYFIQGASSNRTLYGIKFLPSVPEVTAFSPASGSTVKTGTTVTITGTTGSTIYYMWGTSTPPANAAAVVSGGTAGTSGAATVTTTGISSSNTYLYAVAVKNAVNSALATASYTIDDTAPTFVSSVPTNGATSVATSGTIVLTFSEALGSVDASKFTLTGATKGAVAIDGSDATKVNIPYSGAANSATVTLATDAAAVSDLAGNALAAALSNISFTTAAAAPAGDCITIAYFETTSHSNSSSKPDNAGKYIYGYTNSAKTEAYAYTITSSTGDNKGQGTGESDYLRMNYGTTVTIYADNTTTGGTPASFSNVTSVSVDFKMKNSSYYTTFDILVGNTKIADNVSLQGAAQSAFTTFTYEGLAQLNGKISIVNKGSGSGNYHFYIDNIQICTSSLPACTTPILPTLTAKTVCEGGDADAAWNATITNSGSLVSGETVAYSWVKKGGSTPVSSVATYQPTDVTEAMAGTYVVTATVSADGKASKSASQEVDLSVTEGTEAPTVTQSTTPVYEGNSVTLTATATTGATYTWHTCNSDGTGESLAISGATTNAYTIASAPAAGTHYYKVKVTGDGTHTCGNAETVYALTVSEAAGGDCFHFVSVIPGSNINISSGASIVTPTHATTLEGGTMKVGSQQVVITAGYGLKMEGTKTVSITLESALEAGNVVIVKGTSGTKGYGITINGVNFYDADNKTFDVSYTVLADDGLVGQTALTVSKYSGNSYLQEVKITGCGESCTDPEVTASVNNTTACAGSSVTFTATGAHAEATYQWQKLDGTWTNISDETASTYNIPSVVAGDAGKYRVIASHNCNRTSNEVTLNVPSAPNFGSTVPASVSVMQTIALSINTVEATDATKYKWYKSADATWDAGDTEIGTNKELIKAYDGEAIGSPSYYIFCRAQNACGITTSTAIAVNVTAYVEEDCATRGNESDAEFGFQNSGCGQGTYNSASCWTMNSNSKILIYSAPDGKYFKTMKVTIASSSASKASYNWSTDGGTSYTEVAINSINTTLTEKTIDVSAHGNVNALQIGRNLDGEGESSGTLYVSKICFEYTDACTATTVTPSETSTSYVMGGSSFTEPTFTVKHGGTAFDPQPTLTYTSSDEDIATVDDDGTVNFQGRAGSVTITASYAGGEVGLTDYCASEGSYTITVSCSGDAPKIVEASTVDLSGCNSSVVLNAKEQDGTTDFTGGSYQWLRNGEEIDGATNKSYTATQAGIYTVEYTSAGGCTSVSTNSAVVTSETTESEVERLVPFQYYHVNKTYSDQMKMRHLFAVKNSGTLDGKHFKMYVSRNGAAATDVTSSNALVVVPNGDGHVDTVMVDLNKLSGKYAKGDELVYTCKAIDCESHVSETYKSTIQMHVIDTDTATLALICSGSNKASGTRKTSELTVGGDFLTGYNVADLCEQTGNTSFDANTEWGLYTKLKTQYIVTPVNGYAVFNKLNYEPFDILLLTDYPKASKSDAAKDVLDDMAALCDYRPMLSFKTHMVAKSPSKWAAKGFTTSATENKADGRLNLNIVCYAHPMFEGLKSGEDVYTDVGNTSAPLVYTMLTGTGFESSKGMQGFELAAAENFVTIGLTHYNATIAKDSPLEDEVTWTPGSEDRMLVTVAERQANPEARFILFSLNCGAQSKLTDKGEEVVLACLNYLLGTAEGTIEPADCSFTFDNGESNEHEASWYSSNCPSCTGTKGDGKWTTAANWGPDYRLLPGEFNSVRIKKPVEVNDEHAHVMDVRIIDEGSIDIPAGKGLDVKSTIRRMDGSEIYPTEIGDIHIGSASTGNGTLIFNNDEGDTKARVDMYSKGKTVGDMKHYQYIGTPFNEINALYNYYGARIYSWTGSGWTNVQKGGTMYAWTGYCISSTSTTDVYYQMEGTMAATGTVDINVPADAYMVVGNSWTAPISIQDMTTDDFENLTANIYFFNTGVDKSGGGTVTDNATGDARWAPGTYVNIPIASAPYTGSDDHIPSLQGFFVNNKGGSAGTLHLDYDKHVRKTTRDNILSGQMHAPRRAQATDTDEPVVLKMKVSGENYDDKLVLLGREDFSEGFDNGWDGDKWDGNESALYIYTTDNNGTENSVSAIPELEGTVIGFRAGEDDAYTLNFEYLNSDETLYLYDVENNTYTQIMTGMTYRFFTTDNEKHARFIITRSNGQEVATGVESTSGSLDRSKAKKLLIEDKMFIMVNGMLYDATGKVVK